MIEVLRTLKQKIYWGRVEVVVLSPPKAGRTWFRLILVKIFSLVYHEPLKEFALSSIRKKHKAVPKFSFTHGRFDFGLSLKEERFSSASVCKRFQNKKVIFLVRDPRDVIVSSYYEAKYRTGRGGTLYGGSLSQFIREKDSGLERLVEGMNFWIELAPRIQNFYLLKYEDLKISPLITLRSVFNFLALDYDVEDMVFKKAIEYTSFENMKKMEKGNVFHHKRLAATDPDNPNTYKVRKGEIGGYKEELSSEDIAFVNKEMKRLSPLFGYKI